MGCRFALQKLGESATGDLIYVNSSPVTRTHPNPMAAAWSPF
jgi:hypothetical protein